MTMLTLGFDLMFLYRLPNGKPDPKSKHGGCPVLSGVKVSANEQRATQSVTDCTITFVDSCYPQHSYNGFFLVLIVFLFRQYAANLWVWNTPRDGYPGNPKNPDYKADSNKKKPDKAVEEIPPGRVTATFKNSAKDIRLINAQLYFNDGTSDKEWGPLGFGEEFSIYTYKSHIWKVIADGEVFHTFTIDSDQPTKQEFVVQNILILKCNATTEHTMHPCTWYQLVFLLS